MPTLRQIEIFTVLCKELHFGKAAAALGISQAALSMEIRKLEKNIGGTFFDRTDKWNIRLTDIGKIYLNQVKDIPAKIESAEKYAKRASRGEIGKFVLGVTSSSCDYFDLGALCSKMLKTYPAIKLAVKEIHFLMNVIEKIKDGEYDAGIIPFSKNLSDNFINGLKFKKISSFPLYWSLPANHPLAAKDTITFSDLKNESLILPSRGMAQELRNYFEKCFIEGCGKLPHIAYEVDGLKTSQQFVSHGLGIGISTKEVISDFAGKIVFKPFPEELSAANVVLWHGDKHSKILMNFLSLI